MGIIEVNLPDNNESIYSRPFIPQANYFKRYFTQQLVKCLTRWYLFAKHKFRCKKKKKDSCTVIKTSSMCSSLYKCS